MRILSFTRRIVAELVEAIASSDLFGALARLPETVQSNLTGRDN